MRTRTRGKILLRNCARRSKVSKPLMSEGVGELKWACPLCSDIGKFVLSYIIKRSAGCALRRTMKLSYATAAGARMCEAHSLFKIFM